MYMENWISKLNAFLQFNEKDVLEGKGKISQEVANQLATDEFEKYIRNQDRSFESDFDKMTKKLLKKNNLSDS